MKWGVLFAGAGGADLGLRRAGHRVVIAVEADRAAHAALCYNSGVTVAQWARVGPPQEAPSAAYADVPGIGSRSYALLQRVDAIWASPPCQSRSKLGKRLLAEDGRDGWDALSYTLAQIQQGRDEQHRQVLVVENVYGAPFEAWAAELPALGYKHTWVGKLDAADFGAASRRQRGFIVASTHPWSFRPPQPLYYPQTPCGLVMGLDPRAHPLLSRPAPCVVATEVKGHTCPDKDRGVRTPIQRASDLLYLATGRRRMSLAEGRELLGLGSDFRLHGRSEDQYRQLGNVVAPCVAEVLARTIEEATA